MNQQHPARCLVQKWPSSKWFSKEQTNESPRSIPVILPFPDAASLAPSAVAITTIMIQLLSPYSHLASFSFCLFPLKLSQQDSIELISHLSICWTEILGPAASFWHKLAKRQGGFFFTWLFTVSITKNGEGWARDSWWLHLSARVCGIPLSHRGRLEDFVSLCPIPLWDDA